MCLCVLCDGWLHEHDTVVEFKKMVYSLKVAVKLYHVQCVSLHVYDLCVYVYYVMVGCMTQW